MTYEAFSADVYAMDGVIGKSVAKCQDMVIAKIIVRYDLKDVQWWDDAHAALLQRDKYLRLAYAMEETRGDWSDGFYRVSSALGRFAVENDTDVQIFKELSDIMADNDGDGRIFRDCHWNYGEIYGLVRDKTLLADFAEAQRHIQT